MARNKNNQTQKEAVTLTSDPAEGEIVEVAPATEGEAAPAVKKSNSIVPKKFKERYGKLGNCGDELALAINAFCHGADGGVDASKLAELGSANGIDVASKWGHLNVGQQRMNLGNVLRNRVKRGEFATVGDQRWNEAQPVASAA